MIFEKFVDYESVGSKIKTLRQIESIRSVDAFVDKFLADPTKMGPVLVVKESQDKPEYWPTMETYRLLSHQQQLNVVGRCRCRMRPVLDAIQFHMRTKSTPNFRRRFKPIFKYFGDGRVVVCWQQRWGERKEKLPDGTAPVDSDGATARPERKPAS